MDKEAQQMFGCAAIILACGICLSLFTFVVNYAGSLIK